MPNSIASFVSLMIAIICARAHYSVDLLHFVLLAQQPCNFVLVEHECAYDIIKESTNKLCKILTMKSMEAKKHD